MGAAARFVGRHVNQAFLAAEEAARQAQEKIRRDAQAEATRREREWGRLVQGIGRSRRRNWRAGSI
jgi:hypothetical protein